MNQRVLYSFLLILLVLPLSSAAIIDTNAMCCLDADGFSTPAEGSTPEEQEAFCGFGSLVVLCSDITTNAQCCFDGGITMDFGLSDETQVNQVFCENFNENFVSEPPVDGMCISPQTPYTVSGQVTLVSLDGVTLADPIPLESVQVEVGNAQNIVTTTDADGNYNLGEVIPVSQGPNIFQVTNYATVLNYTGSDPELSEYQDQLVGISCEQTVESVDLEPASEPEPEAIVDFELFCTIDEDYCIPDWVEGPWGVCTLVDGNYIRTRSVTDDNQCGTTAGRPPSVQTQASAAAAGEDWICPDPTPGNVCGDGIVQGIEECDDNMYILPAFSTSQERPNGVACNEVYPGTGSTGTMFCTDECAYDISACQDPCLICDDVADCDTCETCSGAPLCTQLCEEAAPRFYGHLTDSERQSIRDPLESYIDPESEDPEDAYFTGVFFTPGSTDVRVQWHWNEGEDGICLNQVENFIVHVCEEAQGGNGLCNPATKEEFSAGPTESYTIPDFLEPEKTYCFNVCSVSTLGLSECAYAEGESLPCFDSGLEYCHEYGDEGLNCEAFDGGQEHPYGCIEQSVNGETLTNHQEREDLPALACGLEEVCVETLNNGQDLFGAACIATPQCERCNGFLGLYASYEVEGVITSNLDCMDYEYDPEDADVTPNELSSIGSCYLEQATNRYIDEFLSCDNITTCYDYTSERACGRDPCFKFSEVQGNDAINGCQWNDYNPELGIGVCAPVAEEEQDCTLCDTDSPTGVCDDSMCGAFGECYFKEQRNHDQVPQTQSAENEFYDEEPLASGMRQLQGGNSGPQLPACIAKEAITCFFYENEADCTGGQPAEHAIEYNWYALNYGGIYDREGGNHSRTPSLDVFGLGTCKWVDNPQENILGCFKDSDDALHESSPPVQVYDDCFEAGDGFLSDEDQIRCLYDHEPPVTNVTLREPSEVQIVTEIIIDGQPIEAIQFAQMPRYGEAELDELVFTSNDNEWAASELDLYWNLHPRSESCTIGDCPDGYPEEAYDIENSALSTGPHVLIFYAQDPAKNLEVLKYREIFVDTDGPEEVEFTTTIDTYQLQNDVYRSNLSIDLIISEVAWCQGALLSVTESNIAGEDIFVPGNTFGASGQVFNANYSNLPDGVYEFQYNCTDVNGNDLVASHDIFLDGNPAITNPYPRGELFASFDEIGELNITTQSETASCRYDTAQLPYDQSMLNFAADGTIHSDVLFEPTAEPYQNVNIYEESGSYYLFTSCYFPDNVDEQYMEQDPGDVIFFTVDMLPPLVEIELLDNEDGIMYSSPVDVDYDDYRQVTLTCDDNVDLTMDEYFGCEELEFCIGPATEESFTTPPCYNGETLTVQITTTQDLYHADDGDARVYYRARDQGGNQGAWQTLNPKLRNTDFEDPFVYIID